MDLPDVHAGEEVKRLRRCISDLISLMTLPAMWSGADPSQIARTLIDVLHRLLHLQLIYVRLMIVPGEGPIELARAQSLASETPSNEIGAQLNRLLGDDRRQWPARTCGRFGDKELSIVPLRLGLQDEISMLVVGADRPHFPVQTEELLLQVAANQAVIALHEARLRSQARRLAAELDQRVAQRTKELATANQQLQLQVELLQLMPVVAWTLRPDGMPDFVNRNWLEYTGQPLEFALSHPEAWMTVVHPDDREVAFRSFWDGVRSGRDFAMETRFRRVHDGAYRWHLNRAVALRDADGKIVKFVGTSTDIEDLKHSQQELRNTQAELANMARVMTLGQLTASIAHEVNQPLSGIITNASTCLRMLDANPPNIEGARETARRTIRDGNRAADVITRLRALFSKQQAIAEPVDVNEATREVIALLLTKLQRNGVNVRYDCADDLPLVLGDRVQLQQVIMNLLQNALDAMTGIPDNSRQLLIRTERDEDDRVRLTVRDTGVGLNPHTAGRMFDPFYSTKDGGMGIGLAVSRSIIDNHRGRIWAAANEGPGAAFSFSIPVARECAIDETPPKQARTLPANQATEVATNL